MGDNYTKAGANYGFFFDQTKCTGCKACEISCIDKYDLPLGVFFRRVVEYSGGSWQVSGNTATPSIFTYYTSVSCNHCENPACVKVCPTTAMTKRDDGTVYVNDSKCVGCGYCKWACPYDAPVINPNTGHTMKCDMCYDYRSVGQEPACVAACPSRALDWGPIDDLRKKYGTAAGFAPLPDPSITKPHLVVKPHKDAQLWNQADGEINNPGEI